MLVTLVAMLVVFVVILPAFVVTPASTYVLDVASVPALGLAGRPVIVLLLTSKSPPSCGVESDNKSKAIEPDGIVTKPSC